MRGVVTDASGGTAAGALVEAWVTGRRAASARTGADGAYQVEVPAQVPFELRVRLDGFAQQVVAVAGQTQAITRDVSLPVAGVSDALVVTATRNAESLASVTESVSSFSRKDIEALGSSSLADVVRYVPAVNVESAGREGALTSMFSRGGESDYNLVLVDGVRVNLSGGAFDFSRINAAEIDRVEVVRGAQSALWGSDAMGAVVQIFTRRAGAGDAAQLSAGIEGGSFGTMRGDARVNGGAANGFDYHAGASRRSTDGAFADLLPEDDQFDQYAVDGGIGAMLGRRGTLRASVRYTEGEGRSVGQIVYGARDTGTAYETKDLSGHINFTHAIGSRFTGSATYNDFRYESRSADTIADPAFSTYAILSGTPNALFPNGTRLVRLIDVTEFNTHRRRRRDAGPGAVRGLAGQLGLSVRQRRPSSSVRRSATRATIGSAPGASAAATNGSASRIRSSRLSVSTTSRCSSSITRRSASAGSPLPAAASTARTATTPSSVPSSRPAALWCRIAPGGCRR